MSEPLVPFKNYPDFRDLPAPKQRQKCTDSDPDVISLDFNKDSKAPIEKKMARIAEIHDLVNALPPINRNTL